ncbi:hypothetical protein vseg_002453 [Gypsophila vaccaria]
MAENNEEKKLSLKIMVDVKAKKVVLAEANKQFIDFLFSLMSLPLSSVTKLLQLNKKGMVGCLGTLYESIESLDTQCFKQNLNSSSVLNPKTYVSVPLLSFNDSNVSTTGAHQNIFSYSSDNEGYGYPRKVAAPEYVIGGTVYMVTDNLQVKPMSIAVIKSQVKEFDVLEEKQVRVGLEEGLAILKASMETDTVLTTVFLDKL